MVCLVGHSHNTFSLFYTLPIIYVLVLCYQFDIEGIIFLGNTKIFTYISMVTVPSLPEND